MRWCKFHDFEFTITCFTTYCFAWVCLEIKVQDTHQTINSQNPIDAHSFSKDPNTQPWHTHHFPRISHCAHLSVDVNIFTSPKTKSEFMQPSNLMKKTAPLSIKNIPSSKLYPSQFFECTLEFSVANLHVIMEKEEGC